MASTFYVPLADYIDGLWPRNILEPPPVDRIGKVWIEPPRIETEPEFNIRTALLIEEELTLAIPGIDGVSIFLAAAGEDSAFMFEFFASPTPGMRVLDVPFGIRFADDLLKPATLATDSEGRAVAQADTTRTQVDITLAKVTLTAEFDGDFAVDVDGGIDLPLCLIGDTGVGIQARDIVFVGANDPPPPGRPTGWRGLRIPEADLFLPGDLGAIVGNLTLTDATIGNGGFSGTVADTWQPPLAASLGGMDLTLKSVAIAFVQNCLTQCEILGTITLPFFDVPLDVEIGINLDGSFAVRLAGANGLVTVEKPDLLRLEVHSLGFEWLSGALTAMISGKIKPLVGGLDWPAFDIKALSIDSDGNVKVDGGWIDLRDGYALDFHGFKIEITKIGFGKNDDGGKWIGFSGALKLVDNFAAGASVDGLKVIWYEDGSHDPHITLDGVGVELLVPDAVAFKGTVAYHETTNPDGSTGHQFDGDIKLQLLALDLEADAVLVIGTSTPTGGQAFTYFAIGLAIELPAGIPLWSTGLGLYGLAGIFALNYEPDKHADEEWYGVGPSDGWYKRPQVGITDLVHKWRSADGSLALGAGLTLGTVADNGFIFNGREVLVLVFPGPLLLIEGKANILRERAKLTDEAIFRTLTVLDGRAGTMLFGLDAQYKQASGGELIDIRGSAEGFFDFHDHDRWHLYLGLDDPKEKRIRAELFRLFEADAYFMLDAHGLRTGAWLGYDKSWRYGPVRINLEAWLQTAVAINWKPTHYHGELWAHGSVKMKVFGFGFGMSLDARLDGDVFTPYHLLAKVSVELDLPWPISNVDVDIKLEWGPQPTPPPIPMVLKEIAVEHLKVTTSWPLPRGSLLLPNYDEGGYIGPPLGPLQPADLRAVPVVPLDSRPHLTFGRPVHDAALVGNNPQPPSPARERLGDPSTDQGPATVEYSLRAVILEKLVSSGWSVTARKADTPNPPGVPELYGSWAPVPALGGPSGGAGQVKLWLWSKNPFDYTRATSGSWDEWFTDTHPIYPCIPDAPATTICCDFTRYAVGASPDPQHVCGSLMVLVCYPANRVRVARVLPPVAGIDRAAMFLPESRLALAFLRPARHVEVRLAPAPAAGVCADFDAHALGDRPNAFDWHGIVFTVLDSNGQPQPQTVVRELEGVRCLDAGSRTEVAFAEPTATASVQLVRVDGDVFVEALDADGHAVASGRSTAADPPLHEVVLEGPGIATVVVVGASGAAIASVCTGGPGDPEVRATADFADGTHGGPYLPVNGRISIDAEAISTVTVLGRGNFWVLEVCAIFGPDPKDVEHQHELEQHVQQSTAQWSQVGNVLEPNTTYRLTVVTRAQAVGEDELAGWTADLEQTELAYFRTEGPPGLARLSVPVGHPAPDSFNSGLNDLARYVRQTVPSTVPASGEKPVLPKPVYRAYDVGVEFDEDYVDLMYRITGRDLALQLYDNNRLPVRDAAGRLIVRQNAWGAVDQVTFDATDTRWIEVVNTSTCAVIDIAAVPKDVKLSAAAAGMVLAPDALYEACLTPMLLHETFAGMSLGATAAGPGGALGRWQIVDQGTAQGPSSWQVAETTAPVTRYVTQTTNIWGGTTDGTDPVKPGSLLILGPDPNIDPGHPDQPSRWTDYRLTAYLRNEDDDAIGVVFRYTDTGNYYRFSMDAERRYRRLVRVVNGVHTILAEDDRRFRPNIDYAVTVEAIGSSLRVYVDGEPILDAADPSHPAGGIGLYCWASEKARFFDVTVDDYRLADPAADRPSSVYRFGFTTSKFAHFTHHIHSFDDRLWAAQLAADAPLDEWLAASSPFGGPLTDAEVRAYDALASAVLGPGADSFPVKLEMTTVAHDGDVVALLCQTAEPFDWSRVELRLLATASAAHVAEVAPGPLKLVSASFAADAPGEESVRLVAREDVVLAGHTIEALTVPGPVKGGLGADVFFEDFAGDARGVLFDETFGPNALDHYAIVDQGELFAPSAWSSAGGAILQTSMIGGGALAASELDKPGTLALTGNPGWGSVRIRCRLLSTDDKALGIVFRYRDEKNYYRFSTDSERSYRRLVACVDGQFTLLWEDANAYSPNVAFELQIDAFGAHLVGQQDHEVLFDVVDAAHPLGQVGLYSWLNPGAQFHRLRVESLESDAVLFRPTATGLDGWIVLDPDGAVDRPSAWAAEDSSGIHQRSQIRVEGPDQIGAHLVTRQRWDEFHLSVDLASDDAAAMGVLIRYRDGGNYYRLSLDAAANVRRLVRCVDGTMTTLWQDSGTGYQPGHVYRLSVRAQGPQFAASLDGSPLFTVVDDSFPDGGVGLYTWNNATATFARVWVLDLATRVAAFRIFDAALTAGGSTWRTRLGELQQRSAIGDPTPPQYGTHAVAPLPAPPVMRLTVRARSDTDTPIGVVFRYVDENHYYRFSVSSADHVRRLIKVVGGTPSTLWDSPGGYAPEDEHEFTVDTFGPRLVGYFDGERLFDVSDPDLPAGRIGVYTSRNATAAFMSVRISQPPVDAGALFVDDFAHGDLSAWTFVSEATVDGPANWAVTNGALAQTSSAYSPPIDPADVAKRGLLALAGDLAWEGVIVRARLGSDGAGAIGVVFRYRDADNYYRFSAAREQGYRRVVKNVEGVFTVLWEDTEAAGQVQELVIVAAGQRIWGYLDRVAAFVIEDADLAAGRIGLYCWRNPGARFSSITVLPTDAAGTGWAFKDDFPYLVRDRWSFVDAGEVGAPSAWDVTDRTLVQTRAVSGNQPWKGTYAVSAQGSRDWQDLRVVTGVSAPAAGTVGVAARFLDPQNHYRFEVGAGPGRRLVKVFAGAETELWSDTTGYPAGAALVISVECVDERVTCHVNAVLACEVVDDTFARGRIALFSFDNPGATFAFVRVMEADWQSYYRFGQQPTAPAGRRIRVLAYAEGDTPAAAPNTQDLVVAGPGERGDVHFFGSNCDLRVVDPLGKVQHTRTFLRSSRYEPVLDATLLRRADGTGFAVLRATAGPGGNGFEAGEYRLELTFRRDNTAEDPASQILREAGDHGPESMHIDIAIP